MRTLVSLLLSVLGLGYLGIESFKFASDSRQRIAQARRVVVVDATVTRSSYRQTTGFRGSVHCTWAIEYRYRFEYAEYTSTRLTNVPGWEGCDLARTLLAERRKGASMKVFVDPQRPMESFVAENRTVFGYFWIPALGFVVVVLIGGAAWQPISTQFSRRQYGRWTRLPSDTSPRALARAGVAGAAWWVPSCILCYAVYEASAISAPSSPLDFVFAWIVSAGLVGVAVVAVIRNATFEDAVLAVDPYPLRTGQVSDVRISVRVRRAVTIRNVAVRLSCHVGSGKQRRHLVKADYIEDVNQSLSAGASFDQVVKVTPPLQTLKDTPMADELSSEMTWTLNVFVDGVGLKDHSSEYPLEVVITTPLRHARAAS